MYLDVTSRSKWVGEPDKINTSPHFRSTGDEPLSRLSDKLDAKTLNDFIPGQPKLEKINTNATLVGIIVGVRGVSTRIMYHTSSMMKSTLFLIRISAFCRISLWTSALSFSYTKKSHLSIRILSYSVYFIN